MTRRKLMLAAILAGSLAACGGDGDATDDASPSPTAAQRPSSTAELTIVRPEPGGEYPPDDVPVRLELEGAMVSEEASTDLKPDEGHIHLSLDGELLTLLGGTEENLAELAEGPLEPGQHILEAEFVANDHGFFLPRVVQTVTFMVEG